MLPSTGTLAIAVKSYKSQNLVSSISNHLTMKSIRKLISILAFATSFSSLNAQKSKPLSKPDQLKQELIKTIDGKSKDAQVMVDMVFSFSELGFQEIETSAYLTGILEKNGFTIEKGISGMPTAWLAKWGSGKPVIALGSDIDCIPKASQKPGVAYKEPIVDGAPGHGEGHNSGLPLVILSAIEVKKVMEREKLPGTLIIWPGVAEELLGSKAWYIRDGIFKNVDACIFTHVGNNLGVSYGDAGYNAIVSVEFKFEGAAAHSAGAPWRGKSALDAVELMNVAWNFKREHLKPTCTFSLCNHRWRRSAQCCPFQGRSLVFLTRKKLRRHQDHV